MKSQALQPHFFIKPKMKFILCLLLAFSVPVFAAQYDRKATQKEINRIKKDIRRGRLKQRADHSLNHMITLAVNQLEAKGEHYEADKLWDEWTDHWQGYLLRDDRATHAPFSQWLEDVAIRLEAILGPDLFAFLHLDDIRKLNECLPIVLWCEDHVGIVEYEKYFDPFTGIVGYWSVFGACTFFTMGSGWFVVCTPLAMLSRHVCQNEVGPLVSDISWHLVCE